MRSTACTCGTTFSPSTTIVASSGAAQRGVQHRAVLGDVDLVAAEHRVDALTQAGPARQLQEETQRLVGDAVLRVVEVDAFAFDGQALAALRVGGEEVAQVGVAHLLEVLLERVPLRTSR